MFPSPFECRSYAKTAGALKFCPLLYILTICIMFYDIQYSILYTKFLSFSEPVILIDGVIGNNSVTAIPLVSTKFQSLVIKNDHTIKLLVM